MNIYEKLTEIQNKLKVEKTEYNKFGNFTYRNAESILEAVKPLLKEYKLTQICSAESFLLGTERYVNTKIILINAEEPTEIIEINAPTREQVDHKKMNECQITGSAISYSKKYALQNLYALDDAKQDSAIEVDSLDNSSNGKITKQQYEILKNLYSTKQEKFMKTLQSKGITFKEIQNLPDFLADEIIKEVQ